VYKIGGLQITAPADWLDVTDEIEEPDPPFSLARPDGVGAIQFSVAEFRGGKQPGITLDALNKLLTDFAQSRELGRSFDLMCRREPLLTAAMSFDADGRFWRVWYCSDGQSVALVTYNCRRGEQEVELPDCENVVRDLQFTN
jgi:hypothetical protein